MWVVIKLEGNIRYGIDRNRDSLRFSSTLLHSFSKAMFDSALEFPQPGWLTVACSDNPRLQERHECQDTQKDQRGKERERTLPMNEIAPPLQLDAILVRPRPILWELQREEDHNNRDNRPCITRLISLSSHIPHRRNHLPLSNALLST